MGTLVLSALAPWPFYVLGALVAVWGMAGAVVHDSTAARLPMLLCHPPAPDMQAVRSLALVSFAVGAVACIALSAFGLGLFSE